MAAGGRAARYVAIITDGNGRWASERGLDTIEGHRAGADTVKARLMDAAELGVKELTVYSFSTENWSRPAEEVTALMRMFSERIRSETPELRDEGVRMRFIGRRDRVSQALLDQMDWAEQETAGGQRITLFVAFDYGGRNEILDAVQDAAFLGFKHKTLEWQREQTGVRGGAELAVLDSQRATYDLNAQRRREDVAALELRAPNDGVFVLNADWGGEKPKVGASMWAAQEFGALPELSSLEVQFALTQLDAQGVKVGSRVKMHALGRPDQEFVSEVSWVAGAAQSRSRQNPVKYLLMKAQIPAEAVAKYKLVPGQGMAAEVFTGESVKGLTVPNVALIADGGKTFVEVRVGSKLEKREVALGARGTARSEVLKGLKAGDAVVLTPAANAADPDAKRFSAPAGDGARGGRGGGGMRRVG